MLFFDALTIADRDGVIDPASTDLDVHWRSGSTANERLLVAALGAKDAATFAIAFAMIGACPTRPVLEAAFTTLLAREAKLTSQQQRAVAQGIATLNDARAYVTWILRSGGGGGLGDKEDRVVVTGKAEPKSNLLAAATAVVIEKGPKIKSVLSHMDRGLSQRLGLGTWDAVVSSLVDNGVVAATHRRVGHATRCCNPSCDAVVAALRAARRRRLEPRCCTAVHERSGSPARGRRSLVRRVGTPAIASTTHSVGPARIGGQDRPPPDLRCRIRRCRRGIAAVGRRPADLARHPPGSPSAQP